MRFKNYIIYPFCFLTVLFISIAPVFAQGPGTDPGTPCDIDDASGCPLDTWVYLLAAVAIIFTYRHLAQQQKKSLATQ